MEATEVKKRGRGRPRKRRREEDENDGIEKGVVSAIKKQDLELRWKPLVGRYVLKEFAGNGNFLGKVVYYDTGLYRVDYEDGDCEDLESRELRKIVLGDDYFNDDLGFRRQKLDELLLKKSAQSKKELEKKAEVLKNEVHGVEAFSLGKLSGGLKIENDDAQGEGDTDSSNDSCEYAQYGDLGLEMEAAPIIPPPRLPPSSGNIGVPEEYVTHLFSVYAFLRSFNICLFLSPFTLDDLVGAVNCHVQNTLLDAIHVALIRALRSCLETQSSDGSELASRCLRCIDWSLLDSLTWPVYLVHYLTIMGHVKGLEWEEFYDDLLKREYYSLPVSRKLLILQLLCDDVLESAVIRAEIDIREELEDGIDPDAVATSFLQNAPKRVHPRYSKTSACKDKDGVEIISGSQEVKTSWIPKYLGSNLGTHDVGVDGNSDECRLCGMDGTLLCCDGCPSAYHSRCIGVAKMYIPDGPWYCPECTINKLGPTIRIGASLRGAELFGADLYQQAFLGTCDHLLVVSIGRNSSVRYYNYKDIPNVLVALSASMQHRSLYEEISKAIAEYWKILPSAIFSSETIGASNITSIKEDDRHSIASFPFGGNKGHRIQDAMETETRNALIASNVDNVSVPFINNFGNASIQDDSHGTVSNGDVARTKSYNVMNMMPMEQIKVETHNSLHLQTDLLDVTHQYLVDKSSAVEPSSCTCINIDGSHIAHANGTCAPGIVFSKSKDANHAGNSLKNCLYVGAFFKPYAYINHYMHGDFAASAAACLAVLSSEESQGLDIAKSGSVRKAAADISLQVKAFSTVASRFFWPSYEKKLMDVPRERCGWCFSCKIPASSKKACMLNAAALTATKGTMKVLSGIRPIIHGEGCIRSISTYILYMGEVLSGLTVGPFLNASYIEQWRRRVEGASTCSGLIGPLLELEQSIRMIALSGDWIKVMDDSFAESSGAQNTGITGGYAQKRGPYGRRHRKQSAMSDVMPDDCSDKSFIWWRGDKLSRLIFHKAVLPQSVVKRAAQEGGSRKIAGIYYADDSEIPKRSRQLVWRAAVERSRNASQLALQVRYLDLHIRWSDLVRPEQNVQDAKGLEAESSFFRNADICDKKIKENKSTYGVAFGSQKHLPSRILKNIIEIEQSENGMDKYWFSETHVPLYLIKEFEEKTEKLVFPAAKKSSVELSELQKRQLKASRQDIFLYLTCKRDKLEKCFCASCQCDVLLRYAVKCNACQGFCHGDCTTSSPIYGKDNLKFLITCKQCNNAKAGAYNRSINESPTSPLSLPIQEFQNALTVTKGTRIRIHKSLGSVGSQEQCSEAKQAATSSSLSTKNRSRSCNWGVIWKKKHNEDTGIDFRHKNILLRGDANRNGSGPICNLCRKPYNCNLIYIHCETCNNWFHAEAVELQESRLSDVVGFKCCRCRRIKPPKCPYRDGSESEKLEAQKPHKRALKEEYMQASSESGATNEFKEREPSIPITATEELFIQDDPLLFSVARVVQTSEENSGADFEWNFPGHRPQRLPESKKCEPSVPMDAVEEVATQDDNPLLSSVSKVEQVTEENSGADFEWNVSGHGPQKLPVRRHGKIQGVAEGISHNDTYRAESAITLGTNNLIDPKGELSCVQWNVPNNGFEGEMFDYEGVNYEDMEFEPQTYFSFTELLESNDGGHLDGLDASENVFGNCDNHSCSVSLGVSGQYVTSTSIDQQEATVSQKSNVKAMLCKMCSYLEPSPDLTCEICGLVMHSHCSPWIESSPPENPWRCGHCREWR